MLDFLIVDQGICHLPFLGHNLHLHTLFHFWADWCFGLMLFHRVLLGTILLLLGLLLLSLHQGLLIISQLLLLLVEFFAPVNVLTHINVDVCLGVVLVFVFKLEIPVQFGFSDLLIDLVTDHTVKPVLLFLHLLALKLNSSH